MKNTLLISLLIISSLIAQPRKREGLPVLNKPFQFESIVIPISGDNLNYFYTYKIPYNRLVFEKNNSSYSAGLRVLIEITDEDSKLISRDIKDTELTVESFEITNEPGLFLQDYLNFEIPAGVYNISATVTDLNTETEIKLEPHKVEWNEINSRKVVHPLVIHTVDDECGVERIYKLANFGGVLPFSPLDYHLIIPVLDTTIEKLSVKVINNGDTLINQSVTESYTLPVGISKCKDNLVVQRDENSTSTKNFVLRNVNHKLHEGKLELFFDLDNGESEEFHSEVVWINKPLSLQNPEMAIELLNFIEADSVIYRLLSADESEYPDVLNTYWAPFDPNPETSFNPLMNEYYRRIDYAAREFRGLGRDNGIKTDRGKIYIRFGKPELVERSSNSQGQVVETWIYTKPERKFVFVDKRGVGNFTLIEN